MSTETLALSGVIRDDVVVRASTARVDLRDAVVRARIMLDDANRAKPLEILGGRFEGITRDFRQAGAWVIGPALDQNVRSYGDITVRGATFRDISAHLFHAWTGATAPSTYGHLAFEDIVATNLGAEAIYAKGPQIASVTLARCRLGGYATRTGWATDHTAWAGDGIDLGNASAEGWDGPVLIHDCDLINLDGAAILCNSNTVTILRTRIEHCHDPAGPMRFAIWHDPAGPRSLLQIDGCTIISARPDSGLHLRGKSGVQGQAIVSNTRFVMPGPSYINTLGRIAVTEVNVTHEQAAYSDPKEARQ
jgi:hypothetical protein